MFDLKQRCDYNYKKNCKHYYGVDRYVHHSFSLKIVIFLD